MMHVHDEFAGWATSFGGCDGGNLRSPVWFCGIEFGGSEDPNRMFVPRGPEWAYVDSASAFFEHQYNRSLAKLYVALCGSDLIDYKRKGLELGLFTDQPGIFKANLYPLGFRSGGDELWSREMYRLTGCPTKSIYRAWCQVHRFPLFQRLLRTHQPSLVICTGLSYSDSFLLAFDGIDGMFEGYKEMSMPERRRILTAEINGGRTVLAVVPFFGGRFGLNSDSLLESAGTMIRSYCADKGALLSRLPRLR